MANESQSNSAQHDHRNGRATQVSWNYTDLADPEQEVLYTEEVSISHSPSILTVESKHALPLLLGAILAGAAFGFFWKRK